MEVTLCTHLALHIEERLSKTVLPWGPTVSRWFCPVARIAGMNSSRNIHWLMRPDRSENGGREQNTG